LEYQILNMKYNKKLVIQIIHKKVKNFVILEDNVNKDNYNLFLMIFFLNIIFILCFFIEFTYK